MELTNEMNAWAAAKVSEVVREAIAWLLVMQIAELGIEPTL